jgi:hypothetical protein
MQDNDSVVRIGRRLAMAPLGLVVWLAMPRCPGMIEPEPDWMKPPPKPYGPKTEGDAPRRTTLGTTRPTTARITLPDEVIVRVMDSGRPAFQHCFKRAIDLDPGVTYKVRLHVELDEVGKVVTATADAPDAGLTSCLGRVARALRYPAPGKPAVLDLPLFFRP